MSRIIAKQVASSTLALPADTFIYALARLQTSYAAISSNDALTIFDPRTLGINTQIAHAHRGLTCLCANDGNLFTAGRDGNVRVWDSRTDSATRTASLTLTTRASVLDLQPMVSNVVLTPHQPMAQVSRRSPRTATSSQRAMRATRKG